MNRRDEKCAGKTCPKTYKGRRPRHRLEANVNRSVTRV